MPHGGPRPGAGRPPGRKNSQTLSKEMAREAARVLITSQMEDLIASQVAARSA